MKVALVYDWIHTFGGAERILLALNNLFPQADFFTSVYDSDKQNVLWAKSLLIHSSFMQGLPFAKSHHELYPFLTPFAFESFDFSEYDLVISVTSADAKGIITKPKTLHICYLLTPTRYLWSHQEAYINRGIRLLSRPFVSYLKQWDVVAKTRPDFLISISNTVKQRVQKYYGLASEVIYPPVIVESIIKNKPNRLSHPTNYFLVVSRLVPFKRVDLAIKACCKLKLPLVVIGEGRAKRYLKEIASPSTIFINNLTDSMLISYYQNCRAVIVPSEEDFGIVAVESQASGKPVIAFGKGGICETVIDGKTGILFNQQKEKDLEEALIKFAKMKFSENICKKNSIKYSYQRFCTEFRKKVNEYINYYNNVFS